ncbi:acetyl-CoA hydrolase/transferase family protein [gamma proteobacterium HTCC5015]|nr:acetyl-CoA hydrolase/transferase family protein [gamma proteobacterium HTCC5015]
MSENNARQASLSQGQQPERFTCVDRCVDAVIERLGGNIVLGIPLGLGKPNAFVNALYRRAKQNTSIRLKIVTALSLAVPATQSDIERRFAEPFFERVFGDYEALEYLYDVKRGQVPDHIEVCEFFFKPGDMLGAPYAQQHYISSNYTHVARDLISHGVNLLAQMVAVEGDVSRGDYRISLSCNPDVTLDLIECMEREPHFSEHEVITVAQVHRDLPFMPNDAEVEHRHLDFMIDCEEAQSTLFSTPNDSVGLVDHMMGVYASALVKEGGTLQIGIGAMSDAFVNALLLRQQRPEQYRRVIQKLNIESRYADLVEKDGGLDPFEQGLYGSSEMFVNGFRFLIDAGVIKREVYDDLDTQLAVNRGESAPSEARGKILDGGFFLGPRDFYQWLRDASPELLAKINMSSVGLINQLTDNPPLLRAQRKHARFVNTGLMATLSGAVVSDGLEDGRVLSGVGGQYNFVAMAHQLADARSILLVRATRGSGDERVSNIRFFYGHTTIPRHLRDIVITEYGIADLRGRSDREVYAQMLNVADSRFQPELLAAAKKAHKLPQDYEIPAAFRNNTPDALREHLKGLEREVLFPEFPLGTDFDDTELQLLPALKKLKALSTSKGAMAKALVRALPQKPSESHRAALERMGLWQPQGIKETVVQRLLASLL